MVNCKVLTEAAQKVGCYTNDDQFRHSKVGTMGARFIRLVTLEAFSV